MSAAFVIDGGAIVDIPSLYAELNRVFMADEDWAIGESLDALDDLLYGGYGALAGRDPVTVVWRQMDASRAALGVDATRAWLQRKLARPGVFATTSIQRQLDALDQGTGRTYFDIVAEVFASHPAIRLVAA